MVNPTIARLWRYPVKSMLGERCDELRVEARGAVGDRMYAVRDAEGKLGAARTVIATAASRACSAFGGE